MHSPELVKVPSKTAIFSVLMPYWTSTQRWGAWGLLGFLVILLLIRAGLQVVFLVYGGELTSALAAQDSDRFFSAVTIFAGILVISVPFASLSGYIRDKLALYWRTWLTEDYLKRYLAVERSGIPPFFQLRLNGDIDNPDQRIEEDVRSLTQGSLRLFEIATEAGFQLIGFAGLLWSISQPLMVGLLAYAIVGSLIAGLGFGRPLIRLNTEQLKREANFRYMLAHTRDNKEAIALYQGESQEQAQSDRRFGLVFRNFANLIRWQLGFNLFQNHYRYASFVIPGIILAPRLFAGELEIGDVTQAGAAFTLILSALALIVLQLQQFTRLGAAVQRLQQLTTALSSPSPLDSALSEKRKALQGVALRTVTERSRSDLQTGPTLTFDHFSLTTPDHQKQLIQDLSLSLSPNQSLLIMGESGVGKSSLVRAIAGLWQTGQGTLTCPTSVSFIPQRPYLPKGSLRDVLLYPKCPEQSQLKDSSFYQALEQVNLIHLLKHSLEAPLTQSLSLGEQQRIAFARLLLQPTHYVVLDEATSALDLANEARLYQQLLTHDIVPISIGHRHSLKQFHQQLLTLSADGSWQYETI